MKKYVYVLDYREGWMILLYENGRNVEYYNCAEDDWDKSLRNAKTFNATKENSFYYELDSYDQLDDINVFNLNENGLECFNEFRKSL